MRSQPTPADVAAALGPELASIRCDNGMRFDESDYRDADDGLIYLIGDDANGDRITVTLQVTEAGWW